MEASPDKTDFTTTLCPARALAVAAQSSPGVISVVISDVKRQLHDFTLSLDHSQEAMSSELSGSLPPATGCTQESCECCPTHNGQAAAL